MHQDLEALLALQADDDVIDGLDGKLRALGPRLSELERRRKAVAEQLANAEAATEADERKHRELEGRLSDHKQRQERNLAHLDSVKRMREATAAMAQVEQARKILIEEESELQSLTRRIADGHKAIAAHREALAAEDSSRPRSVSRSRASAPKIEGTLAEARAKRTQTSSARAEGDSREVRSDSWTQRRAGDLRRCVGRRADTAIPPFHCSDAIR